MPTVEHQPATGFPWRPRDPERIGRFRRRAGLGAVTVLLAAAAVPGLSGPEPVALSTASCGLPTAVASPCLAAAGHRPRIRAHHLGGFEIGTPADANLAKSLRLAEAQNYGPATAPASPLGLALAANDQHVWDSVISSGIYYYECNRLYTTGLISKQPTFCGPASYYTGDDLNWLIARVTAELQKVQTDPEVDAFWALDDQAVLADPGTLKPILDQIHALVHQYTPKIPMICGFGAGLAHDTGVDSFTPAVALNFSSTACDEVGLYIYSAAVLSTNVPPSSAFHWNLQGVMPRIVLALQQQGWDQRMQPMIGIADGFGGVRTGGTIVDVPPSPADMVTEAQGFVSFGAADLVWYGFGTTQGGFSSYDSITTSATLQEGVRQAGAAARKMWRNH